MARTPRRRIIVLVVVIGIVALVGLFAAVGLLSGGSIGGGSDASAPGDRSVSSLGAVADEAQVAKAEDAAAGGTAQTDVALAVPPASAYSAHHLIRTGDLSLLVAKGTLLSTVDRITSLTTASGGYVLSSAIGSDYGAPVPLAEDVAVDGSLHREHRPRRLHPVRHAHGARARACLRRDAQTVRAARQGRERVDLE